MKGTLIFDVSLRGFAKRYSKYLRLLGYRVIIAPDYLKNDHLLADYAKKLNAIIVTTDKWFPYDNKIVLPMDRRGQNGKLIKPKYEVWYTILLNELASRDPHRPMSKSVHLTPRWAARVGSWKTGSNLNGHEVCAGGRID